MAFAALTIDLDARLAKFEEGMRRATSTVENSAKSMEGKLALVKSGITALAGVVSVGLFANMAKEMVTSAAALDDFAEKTGASVEKLSQLQQVAKIGGQDFAGVTDLITKMSRALSGAGADNEAKGVGAGLAAIGLQAEELRRLDPADALKRIALALNNYNDSGDKTAIVQAILGKSAAEYLPYLKDLATTTGITTKVTAEQAAQAEILEKALKNLSLESYNAKQSLLLNLVPTLNDLVERFRLSSIAAGGFVNMMKFNLGQLTFGSSVSDLGKLRTELQALERQQIFIPGKGGPEPDAKIDGPMKALQQQIAFLEVQKRFQDKSALAAEGINFGDVNGGRVRNDLPGFKLPEGNKGAAAQTPFEGLLKQLESETTKVNELSRQFQILDLIARGHYGKLTADQTEQAAALARSIDQIKEQAKIEKETAEAKLKFQIETDNAQKKERDALEELRKKYIELIDPLQKYREQLDEVDKLLEKGVLNQTQATEARFKINEAMDAAAGIGKELEKVKDVSEEVFAKLTSGFEDALVNGAKFQDVLRGIGKDLLKIFVREQITNPASSFLKSSFKDFNFGSLFGSGSSGIPAEGDYGGASTAGGIVAAIKGLFGFASGGEFTVGGSGGTDSQLVAFRASPNETVSIRTPAQQQQNAGGGVTIVQNMQFGSDVNRSMLAAWAERTKADTIAAVANLTSRGGSYARVVRG